MSLTKLSTNLNLSQKRKSLILGPIQTIRIPLIRQQNNEQFSNQHESDLTELSWLTNNMLNSNLILNTTSIPKPKTNITVTNAKKLLDLKQDKDKDDEFNSKEPYLQSPESPSSLSNSSCSSSISNSSLSPCLSPCSACNKKPKDTKKECSISRNKKYSLNNKKLKSSINNNHNNHDLMINENELNESQTESSQFKNMCGLSKPSLTLSCLIFMALEESKDKCLPVREIYEWIEENFPYYKNNCSSGWKSSIRHNLSFSKCFKKMDRNESVYLRSNYKSDKNSINDFGRKRQRAPNSVGTCWKVNEECKTYLIHTLKKSSFWYHNSKYYPKLDLYINSIDLSELKTNQHNHHNQNMAIKRAKFEDDLNTNLIKFVQEQQEKLKTSLKNCDKDLIDLNLSASSSSLTSAFSSLSSNLNDKDEDMNTKRLKIDENELLKTNLSSDLEMEVASTLVDMKRFASRKKI